ncbi:MAG: PQQ-binding-like beta-propeller repeat protein [Phycisphaerales bacterium]|jgi:outer membrane protein assembly factor BamB|nr:PQQ-binding-like beta-propeller repeat protein [Phycisphaerales bacterium]
MAKVTWITFTVIMSAALSANANWPEFRGPSSNGHSDATGLPVKWSPTKNITWKTPIHGKGWSSPVIWGDQIWMTTAENKGKQLYAVCVSRKSGKILHDVKLFEVEKPGRINQLNSYASPTPVIEEGRVYVTFGTYGTACLDTKTAEVIWSRRDINCDHDMGPGVSPIPYGSMLIMPMDGCDKQFIIALDKKTGKTVWKTDRGINYGKRQYDTKKAFCTPLIIDVSGQKQLIAPCADAIIAYNPNTGKELWKVSMTGFSIIPRPVFAGGLLYVVTDCSRPQLWALKVTAKGAKVAWKIKKDAPQRSSLMVINDLIYGMTHRGYVLCFEAKTGKTVWKQRIGSAYSASPIYADGRIYIFNERQGTVVIKPGRTYQELAVNTLNRSRIMASPAIADKAIYLRTDTDIYRIEKQ